jgi:V8-like Glu-specific endopeptidase
LTEGSSPHLEQEKWLAEKAFREREIALKERQQAHDLESGQQERDSHERELALKDRAQKVSEDDLAIRKEELARSRWRSPLVLAILAAAIAALGNAIVAYVTGQQSQTLEDTKEESARILEMIKTGDADKAAENLRFLANAGLVTDPQRLAAIQRFLATRSPGQGPSLPPASSAPGLQPTRTLPQSDPLRAASLAVGRLYVRDSQHDNTTIVCTAFRVSKNFVLTAQHCLGPQPDVTKVVFAPVSPDGTALASTQEITLLKEVIALSDASETGPDSQRSNAILLELKDPDSMPGGWLTLSDAPPLVTQPLEAVAFLGEPDQMVARDPDCKVVQVQEREFSHQCKLGPGAGGAPILSADGARVIGVEMWGKGGVEWAARSDQLLARSAFLHGLRLQVPSMGLPTPK